MDASEKDRLLRSATPEALAKAGEYLDKEGEAKYLLKLAYCVFKEDAGIELNAAHIAGKTELNERTIRKWLEEFKNPRQ